jgi:hypothetical protein
MQEGYNVIHLIVYNTTLKEEFKIDIIWVRLIILSFLLCKIMWHDVVVIWQLMYDVAIDNWWMM